MRAKEIISKRVINPIKSVGKSMPKLFSVGLVSLLGVMPLVSLPNRGVLAYTQLEQQQQAAADPWSEALRAAHSKVKVATSPGAFGHGVSDMHNLTTPDLLMVFGITAVGSILVYVIANHLLNRNKVKIKSEQLIASAA